MHGASLERLAPNIYAARAGWMHGRYGDPWTYCAVVRVRGPVALVKLGNGRGSRRSNYRSQRAVLRALGERGLRRAWWKRADGRVGRVRL